MGTTVVGIRHGRVHNPDNLIYARLPGFRLSEEGRKDAGTLADALADQAVAEIWASPLERAVETAEILAAGRGLEVLIDERLIEWSFWTRWQGTPWISVRERAPDVFSSYADDPGSLCPEDPLEAVGARVLEWAAEARSGAPDGSGLILAVSHEAPLAAALLAGSGEPISRFAGAQVPHLGGVVLDPPPARQVDLRVNAGGLGAE